MENISRSFPGVLANDSVNLRVRRATFHALIGENGAGKSTLLNILYGRFRPDQGRIFLYEKEVTSILRSPADAIRLGIGLVSQHNALIPALTVLENIVLGGEPTYLGQLLAPSKAQKRIAELANQLGIKGLDVHLRTELLSLALLQKVEILKALYRDAQILLMDEPTATLAPPEVESLFELLHQLVYQGTTVIFVTHKLREVMAHSQFVTVLRRGRNAGDFETQHTTPQELLACMLGTETEHNAAQTIVGADVSSQTRQTGIAPRTTSPLLSVQNLAARNDKGALALKNISLNVFPGEIMGIAGVDGSGQKELAETIVGLRRAEAGCLLLNEADITRWSVAKRREHGIAYIPEDRHRDGLVLDFNLAENLLLGHECDPQWGGGFILTIERSTQRAYEIIQKYDVRVGASGPSTIVRTLSGGNQQKIVIARALESSPRLLVAHQPTRGLDIGATGFVHQTLLQAAAAGTSIILLSLDLDEILALSHRVAVLFNGRLTGVLSRQEATVERVGSLMTGAEKGAI